MIDQLVASDKRRLTAREVAELKTKLREDRLFRLHQLRELADQPDRSWSSSPQQRWAGAQAEVHNQLVAGANRVLADVESALARMASGQYGNCQLCTAPIDLQRLRIVAHARHCARCHRAEEIGA